MQNNLASSKRKYGIFIHEGPDCATFTQTLEELVLLDDGEEWRYALHETAGVDAIIDLTVGQSLSFVANRDRNDAKGLLVRTL